jgi:hypothetical protein
MERTTKEDIRGWLEFAKKMGYSHMIVMCDTFSHEDYPVYVGPGENVREVAEKKSIDMQKVMEVYNLSMDLEEQLNQIRSFNY